MFKRVGIVCKPNDEKCLVHRDALTAFLLEKKVVVVNDQKIADEAQLVIVLGGDGTILNVGRTYIENDIPIVGINAGRLGFLADISPLHMFTVLEEILQGKATIEERLLLACEIKRKGLSERFVALNEVTIHRSQALRMVEFDVFVDGKILNTQLSDGLIVTTPTGSTAYALSSGGPIIHPKIDAFGLVSICPHTISHRPLLLPAESIVEISPHPSCREICFSFDGQNAQVLECEKESSKLRVRIFKHPKTMLLVHPPSYDYYEIIRNKLHWGQSL